MKNLNKLSVVAAFAVGASSLALAFGAFTNFLRAEMPKADRAFESKNAQYFVDISTPDFKYTDAQGRTQNKQQSMAGMKQMFDMAQSVKVEMKIVGITETATGGTCRLDNVFHIVTKPGPDGKTHKMEMHSHTTETWVKTAKGYKVKSIKENKVGKMLMDGKPMPAGVGG